MIIISTILERDSIFEDQIYNTSVVIDNYGCILGKHRANHVSKTKVPNEPTYYCVGNTGHPVFKVRTQSRFKKIVARLLNFKKRKVK